MSHHGQLWSNIDNAATMLYGQDVIDGYKRQLKALSEENLALHKDNADLLNRIKQLKRASVVKKVG